MGERVEEEEGNRLEVEEKSEDCPEEEEQGRKGCSRETDAADRGD